MINLQLEVIKFLRCYSVSTKECLLPSRLRSCSEQARKGLDFYLPHFLFLFGQRQFTISWPAGHGIQTDGRLQWEVSYCTRAWKSRNYILRKKSSCYWIGQVTIFAKMESFFFMEDWILRVGLQCTFRAVQRRWPMPCYWDHGKSRLALAVKNLNLITWRTLCLELESCGLVGLDSTAAQVLE